MAAFDPTGQEALLLNAALNPDARVAASSWEEWASKTELERAPFAELRLIPAVYAHLSRLAPEFKLPNKLRGKARAVFTRNNLLAHEALPLIAELDRHCPVMLTKGLAICVRFGAWSSRPMADVDIQVPLDALARASEIFAEAGWTPGGTITLPSLVHRVSLRRNSLNFAKGQVSVDLHWRLQGGPQEDWLSRQMWESAETFELPGQSVRLQSPEFSVVTALGHGFAAGEERGIALQTIVDSAWLLPLCKSDRLLPALKRAGLLARFATLLPVLEAVGLGKSLPSDLTDFAGHSKAGSEKTGESSTSTQQAPSAVWRQKPETALLRRPLLYRLWNALGRKARLERLLIRWAGPFSKPLAAPAAPRDAYDLQDCRVMDQLAGPGWSWPDPVHRCFWSDRADARLLVPLNHVGDHLLALGFSDHRFYSANPRFDVFANGSHVTKVDLRARLAAADRCLLIPRRLLFGPWVELSLRPSGYRGGDIQEPDDFVLARGVPARDLRVFDLEQITGFFAGYHIPSIYLRILKGEEEPVAISRITAKIAASPLRSDPGLPDDFDPVLYVLAYPDLFENEVDPYHHFLVHGRTEGRLWC